MPTTTPTGTTEPRNDHDNHDCAIHANKGPYQGARTRLLPVGVLAG